MSYELNRAQTGYQMVEEGSLDGRVKTEAITEYRVTFPPNIKGEELANAGLHITVQPPHENPVSKGIRLHGITI